LCELSQSGSQAATLADTTGPTTVSTGLLKPTSTSLEAALALAMEQGMQQGRLALSQAPLPQHWPFLARIIAHRQPLERELIIWNGGKPLYPVRPCWQDW